MQQTQVRSLGWEDPLEKEMATHSSILAWRIPWTEEPGGLQSMGSHRVRHDRSDLAHTHGGSRLQQAPGGAPGMQRYTNYGWCLALWQSQNEPQVLLRK